jgi:GR25 family glycosyltransferase involved in LPS biosynthesis
VLILEDDVLLLPHFESRLERLWRSAEELRNTADNNMSSSRPHFFTMLGFMSNGLPPRQVIASFPDMKGREDGGLTDSLVLPSQTIGFFGYAVTAGAAGGILRATLPLRQAIDSALHHSFPALAANNVQARSPAPSSHDSREHCLRSQHLSRARIHVAFVP